MIRSPNEIALYFDEEIEYLRRVINRLSDENKDLRKKIDSLNDRIMDLERVL